MERGGYYIKMIFIRMKLKLDECPACKGKDLKDVSWNEYPNMYQCNDCDIKQNNMSTKPATKF